MQQIGPPASSRRSALVRQAISRCRAGFLAIALFSAVINVLALTGSIYMLQLYDRVIPSHSVPTLIGLTVIMLLLYVGFGVFDALRMRMLSRLGLRIERSLREPVFTAVTLLPLRARAEGDGQQPVRDLDQIRLFFSSLGPTALFDLPWLPFYLALVYWLHPWLGLLGIAGALVLVVITLITEARSQSASREAVATAAARQLLGESVLRNAESIRALGMHRQLAAAWEGHNEHVVTHQVRASDVISTYGAISKVLRMALQSAVLGLAAYLVIEGQITAGVMIAASIMVSRALAPIEIAITNWRSFLAARQSAARLATRLAMLPDETSSMDLPRPKRSLSAEGLWMAAPGQTRAILQGVSFTLKAGDGLGIIGPSASGKSTLARALVGAWLPQRGKVRLDGAALDQWPPHALGRDVGYLPQSIELFNGTVAQNIARLDPDAEPAKIIAAAQQAGVHDMILRLPDGYQTDIGPGGSALSAGQRQRVALARALYGDPFLVVLDEPNSNLDAEGDTALTQAIAAVRARGGIVIVIAHRPSAVASIDTVLVLVNGRVQAHGPKDEVLRKPAHAAPATAPSHLKVVNDGQGTT